MDIGPGETPAACAALGDEAAMAPVTADQHRHDPHAPIRDLSRPKWTNWMIIGGVMLFWAGFFLWLFK